MEIQEVLDYRALLFQGGDERLDILENGKNKYHVNPLEYEDLFHRGSCTCSTLNPLTAQILEQNIDFEDRKTNLSLREKHTQRLKHLLNYDGKDAFGLVFAPSGSDLAYLPTLFSKILYPKKDIQLILTCPEELGSGSKMAYLGEYYANRTQFDEIVEKGEDLNENYNVNLARFRARNDDGLINKHSEGIKEILEQTSKKSRVGALVIGSKSGIEDDISVIPNIDKEVIWVVDLCQFRNSKKLVNHLLDMGCMVMITGSKFYMAPPFCGVMLVPKSLCEKLENTPIDKKYIKGFDKIFSQHDFTEEFSQLKAFFPDKLNPGLVLRWEIALNEMERFNEIPREKSHGIIKTWNETVRNAIATSKHLELMPHQDKTNQSIISFRVQKNGEYLDYDELKQFYQQVTGKTFSIGKYQKVFFGQPVRYSCGAFIRVAIGAYNIYNLLQQPQENRFDNDKKLIQILDGEVAAIA